MTRAEKVTALQTEAISTSEVAKRVYALRGIPVMFDRDLAEIYNVETKVLKQAVKRNADRFPGEFMFEPTEEELENLRSKFVTSNGKIFFEREPRPCLRSQFVTSNERRRSGRGGNRYSPMAFTEYGVAMLPSVLHSQRAIQINISIIRVFIELRNKQGSQLGILSRLESLESGFNQRLDRLEAQLQNQPISKIAQRNLPPMHQPVSDIQIMVARYFGTSCDDLKSASRSQSVSLPRQIAIYLARKNLRMGFKEIGCYFGGRDHTTILHAYRKILGEVETNTMIRSAVEALGNTLQESPA